MPHDLDKLGPFSIPQLRQIASDVGLDHVTVLGGRPGRPSPLHDVVAELGRGRAVVLLWLETPTFGHFILLHWRKGGGGKPLLELFDPLGTDARAPPLKAGSARESSGRKSWEDYMDDPSGLNGGLGLRKMLQGFHEAGIPLSYNQPSNGPQSPTADSCGLWCLMRAALPCPTPAKFARQARKGDI